MSRRKHKVAQAKGLFAADAERLNTWAHQIATELRPEAPVRTESGGSIRVGGKGKGLGYVKITARPRHQAQNELVLEDFKKTSPPKWRKSAPSCRPTPR